MRGFTDVGLYSIQQCFDLFPFGGHADQARCEIMNEYFRDLARRRYPQRYLFTGEPFDFSDRFFVSRICDGDWESSVLRFGERTNEVFAQEFQPQPSRGADVDLRRFQFDRRELE